MKIFTRTLILLLITLLSAAIVPNSIPVEAAGATGIVRVVKFGEDGITVLDEKTFSYEWMQKMLPVLGDGRTHYYHQGPIFEGDKWDPAEVNNLKDKGAVKGTAIKELCEQVGGMSPDDEVSLVSVDKWHTEFAYNNIYEPPPEQGVITLCWYNGGTSEEGESTGTGYPGKNAFYSAMQIVFITGTPNSEGKFVFGNNDMRISLPQEKYQHYYEGQFPSTNGLSGKWIAEIRIYSGGIKPGMKLDYSVALYSNSEDISVEEPAPVSIPWAGIGVSIAGVLLLVAGLFMLIRRNSPFRIRVLVVIAGVVFLAAGLVTAFRFQPSSDPDIQWNLTLIGREGSQKVLSYSEIRKLPSYSGAGGFFSTVGTVFGPARGEGVLLRDLCGLVGGMTPSDIVMITASDGYSTVFDYDQVTGNFPTYDPQTMKEVPHKELNTVLIYKQDGKPLSHDEGKPLRIAILGSDELLTEGNNWIKWVNKIEVLKIAELAGK